VAERIPPRERGAALMTVLLLVAVLSVITATAFERLTIATKLSASGAALDQARAYSLAAEAMAATRIADLVAADPVRTSRGWEGRWTRLPIPGGAGMIRASDGGNCFNLNSLVSGDDPEKLVARPVGVAQFTALMRALQVDPRLAAVVAAAASDWIDSDSAPQGLGAEDEAYTRAPTPYRTANGWMADPSELRAVTGVTPQLYAVLAPWLCALPTSDLSPINPNTLSPDQAPLLAMLAPDQLDVLRARALLAARPPGGWPGTLAFWQSPALRGVAPPAGASEQVTVRTRWFAVETRVTLGNTTSEEKALFDAREKPARLARRQWGFGE